MDAETETMAQRQTGAEQVFKSTCRMCHGGCGALVYVKDDRVVKIAGDPDCPINHGTMCSKGLAAPQIGVPLRIFVIDLSLGRDLNGLIVMINPEFTAREGLQLEEEGCLSVPGWVGDVLRHEAIVVRGLNRNGEKIKIAAEGWLARIFQHEIDHLDGVLYIDKLVSKDTLRRVQAGTEEAAEAIG